MQKKNIVYTVLFLVILLVIVIISINKFTGNNEDLSGTIGKVDKYRKVQLTEKDIKLRNDLMTDTSAVSRSIKGILLFYNFTNEFAKNTEEWKNNLKGNYTPELKNTISLVDNYSKFIKDNSETVEDALLFLIDVYGGDTTEASVNVELKLKKFNDFVTELVKKDSMIASVIPNIEKGITGLKKSKASKEVINELINAKERFAVNAMPLALILGSQNLVKCFGNTTISNVSNLQGLVFGKPALQGGYTAKPLNFIIFAGDKLNLVNSILLKNNLQYFVFNAQDTKGAQSSLNFVDPVEARSLACGNMVYNRFDHIAGFVINSNSELKGKRLSGFFSQSTLNSVLYSKVQAKLGAW